MANLLSQPLVMIGVDVDPRLPGMRRRPSWDMWDTLDKIPRFLDAMGSELPPLTWLIRSDDTIRHWSGDFDSGFTTRHGLWSRVAALGHELGWHFHNWTYRSDGSGFDDAPDWLPDAHAALARHYPPTVTRTGWDYLNNFTLQAIETLGVRLDFSALPGQTIWWTMDGESFVVDWSGSPVMPYYPSREDYRRPSPARAAPQLLEVPIATFRTEASQLPKRIAWRAAHGAFSLRGAVAKTLVMTTPWGALPNDADVLAFHFHPEELTDDGIEAFRANLRLLRNVYEPVFVTGSQLLLRMPELALARLDG